MPNHDPELFERLDPPAGGLHRLMARIDALERPGGRAWRMPLVAGLGVVAAALLWWALVRPGPTAPSTDLLASATHPSFAALGLTERPEQAVSQQPDGDGSSFRQLPSSSPGVVIFVVDGP
jgi:hypothetical protein